MTTRSIVSSPLLLLALLLAACGTSATSGGADTLAEDGMGDHQISKDVLDAMTLVVAKPLDGAVYMPGDSVRFEITTNCDECTVRVQSNLAVGALFEAGPTADGLVYRLVDGLLIGTHRLSVELLHPALDEPARTDDLAIRVDALPDSPVVHIEPAAPSTQDNLTVVIDEFSQDADHDPVQYVYRWFKDGEQAFETTEPTLSHDVTTRGETWKVIVVARDPYGEGGADTAEVTIGDSAPLVETVVILPSMGDVTSGFRCVYYDWSDADAGDPEIPRYTFLRDGQPMDAPDDQADFPAGITKHDELICRVTPSDGVLDGEPVDSAPVIVSNALPTVATATLTPTSGDVTDVFTCVGEEPADADGDTVTLKTIWHMDDEVLPGETSEVVPGSLFTKGQRIRCEIVPFDGEADGVPAFSEEVVIADAPPTIPSALLAPTDATELTTFTCTPASPVDPDGDPVSISYTWNVAGADITSWHGATLSGDYFDKGDEVVCTVIPEAEGLTGPPIQAKPEVTVQNTPPVLEGASLNPSTGGRQTQFFCNKGVYFDPDPPDDPMQWFLTDDPDDTGEPGFTYVWTLDDEVVAGADAQTFTPAVATPGQALRCGVTAFDGQATAAPSWTQEITLVNYPPAITDVSITPLEPREADVIVCSANGFSDADGDGGSIAYTWLVGGQPVSGVDGSQLTGLHFDKGDAVSCQATPHDGYDDGDTLSSATVVVLNSPPVVDGAQLTPAQGGEGTPFTCSPSASSDPDPGDAVIPLYAWLIDDEPIPGAGASIYTPGSVIPGSTLRCRITPFDGQDEGAPVLSAPAQLVNLPPSLDSVSITPDPLHVIDTPRCEPAGFHDPEGADPLYSIEWYSNSAPVEGASAELLTEIAIARGDELFCLVTPLDGENVGATVASPVVTVQNAIPALTEVTLTPDEGDVSTVFTCAAAAEDLDDAQIDFLWSWAMDGTLVEGADQATFLPDALSEGAQLTCTATPHDAWDSGAPLTSAPATLHDRAPSLSGASVTPDPVLTTTEVTCAPEGYADLEGHEPSYAFAWRLNDALIEGAGAPTLGPEHFIKGDALGCEVTPWDATQAGDVVSSATVTVANTPPTAASATLTPDSGGILTTFTCAAGGLADDDAADTVTPRFAWTLNDQPIEGAELASYQPTAVVTGDQLRCVVTPYDGQDEGAPVTSDPAGLIDDPPTLTGAHVEPAAPLTTDDLVCAPDGYQDTEGGGPEYAFEWFIGDAPVDDASAGTLPAARTAKGMSVSCRVTPGDGSQWGEPASAAQVAVANTPPVLDGATLTPASGDATSTFTCAPGAATDADEDAVTLTYAWTFDEVAIEGADQPTYARAPDGQDGQLRCAVTPWDDEEAGATVTSGPVAYDGNRPPSITGAHIEPAAPTTADDVTCVAEGYEDADGDEAVHAYAWWKNDARLSGPGATGATLSSINYARGDALRCEVTPGDGHLSGAPRASAPVTVVNAPPEVAQVTLSPAEGVAETVFSCTATGLTDDDAGDVVTPNYSWALDGVPIDGVIAAHWQAPPKTGGQLTCTVTPWDGADEGAPLSSAPSTLHPNRAPSLSGATLAPSPLYSTTDATCEPQGFDDPDGDAPVYDYAWVRNDSLIAGQAEVTLSADQFFKDDVLRCDVTPGDGDLEGDEVSGTPVTVQNSPPGGFEIAITPDRPKVEDLELVCAVATEAVDPDGDILGYAFAWEDVDGAPMGQGAALATDGLEVCDQVTCVAQADDGDEGLSFAEATVVFEGSIAAGFDGTGSMIVADGSGMANDDTFTIEAWAKPRALGVKQSIVGFWAGPATGGRGFDLYLDAEGHPHFYLVTDETEVDIEADDFVMSTDQFTHIAATFDGDSSDQVMLFVDGEFRMSMTTVSGTLSPIDDGEFVVGARGPPESATQHFDGAIDELLYYNQPENKYVYEQPYTLPTSHDPDAGLNLLYYDFEEMTDDTVSDLSNKHRDGIPDTITEQPGLCVADNRRPPQPVVTITPDPATTDDDLLCGVTQAPDPDGDAVTHGFYWYVNSGLVNDSGVTFTDATLPASRTDPDDKVRCYATPNDGQIDGPVGESQLVTITGGAGGDEGVLKAHSDPAVPSSNEYGISGETYGQVLDAESYPVTVTHVRVYVEAGTQVYATVRYGEPTLPEGQPYSAETFVSATPLLNPATTTGWHDLALNTVKEIPNGPIWVQFKYGNDVENKPVYFDNDGMSVENWSARYDLENCFSEWMNVQPCWKPAQLHTAPLNINGDFLIELVLAP